MINESLENIYISPLESCNLNCQYCYTKKTKNRLSNEEILSFIEKYKNYLKSISSDLKSILFCGGEVFILSDFVELINHVTDQNIFVAIITNGTIDKLEEIKTPNNCQLLVSLDGPKEIHDKNRGLGNFDKTIDFIKHGLKLGCYVEIMFLVTPDSFEFIDTFPTYIENLIGKKIDINYITQKSISFTKDHPLSNQKELRSLSKGRIVKIKREYRSIPSKSFGCSQIALQSNGLIYGCCESPTPIAKITNEPKIIVDNFLKTLTKCNNCLSKDVLCGGCSDPDFLCGYKTELNLNSCIEVVKKFKQFSNFDLKTRRLE